MTATSTRSCCVIKTLSYIYWTIIDIIAHKFNFFTRWYYDKSIGNEYQKEFKTFHMRTEDTVLHIGCGSFPLTELTLARKIKCSITGIDKDKIAVRNAKKTIKEATLQTLVTIHNGSGESYPVEPFTTIIISSCAHPKENILNHILRHAKKGTKIIIREVETSARQIQEYTEKQSKLQFIASIDHHPFPFIPPFGWKSFYFQIK